MRESFEMPADSNASLSTAASGISVESPPRSTEKAAGGISRAPGMCPSA